MKLLAILSVITLAFSGEPNWEWYTSETGLFTVLTPGKLSEKVEVSETPVGSLSYHIFTFQPDYENADNFLYMISYCDYPEGTVHSDSTDLLKDFFDATVETSVSSVRGELFYAADIKMGDYPGKIWRVNYGNDKAAIKTKAYVVGNRYYAIQTVTFRHKSLNAAIDKFMNSFKILKNE